MLTWMRFRRYTLGVVLSATDPVAVVALLKDLGLGGFLAVGIEGESLLNDGRRRKCSVVARRVEVHRGRGCCRRRHRLGGLLSPS